MVESPGCGSTIAPGHNCHHWRWTASVCFWGWTKLLHDRSSCLYLHDPNPIASRSLQPMQSIQIKHQLAFCVINEVFSAFHVYGISLTNGISNAWGRLEHNPKPSEFTIHCEQIGERRDYFSHAILAPLPAERAWHATPPYPIPKHAYLHSPLSLSLPVERCLIFSLLIDHQSCAWMRRGGPSLTFYRHSRERGSLS